MLIKKVIIKYALKPRASAWGCMCVCVCVRARSRGREREREREIRRNKISHFIYVTLIFYTQSLTEGTELA